MKKEIVKTVPFTYENYDQSQKVWKSVYSGWKRKTVEVCRILYFTRIGLSRPGVRNDLTSTKFKRGWGAWCKEGGIPLSTANYYADLYDPENDRILSYKKVAALPEPAKPEPQLGPEWYDDEIIAFWVKYETEHQNDPKPKGLTSISINKISVPDSTLSKLGINGEIQKFRYSIYQAIGEKTESLSGEELLEWINMGVLQDDDANYHELHLMKALIDSEMKTGDFSNIDNRMQVIKECVEHLNERNPIRIKQGYKELPIDKLVPLADSRKIIT